MLNRLVLLVPQPAKPGCDAPVTVAALVAIKDRQNLSLKLLVFVASLKGFPLVAKCFAPDRPASASEPSETAALVRALLALFLLHLLLPGLD